MPGEIRSTDENLTGAALMSKGNGMEMSPIEIERYEGLNGRK